jgi:DNA-binding MarR family transcriptional regulator
LLHRAGQVANDIFLQEAGDCRLTPRQFAILAIVGDHDGLTQSELVERTGIDRSTLADVVARLLDRRLICRRRAKKDQRAYQISLTDMGVASLRQAKPCASAADALVLAPLPPLKRQDFVDSLRIIVNRWKI